MPSHYDLNTLQTQAERDGLQAAPVLAAALRQHLASFVAPLVQELDACCDARLVRTFVALLEIIIGFRHRACGLLLSELGGYLLGFAHAPAGTKRLSNLLRSPKWKASVLDLFLWRQAEARRAALEQAGEDVLVVWDESVIEKHESRALEGLCAVRSSQAARKLVHKPGFHRPPTAGPIFVPGMNWIALLLMGASGPPTVATMRWWTTRGESKTSARRVQSALLSRCKSVWGRTVIHVFDRGYAGSPWLSRLHAEHVRFLLRWPSRYFLRLHTPDAEPGAAPSKATNAWKLVRGKRAQDSGYVRDARRGEARKVSVLWREVRHPDLPDLALWLVVARQGGGQPPWYLLTSEPVETAEDAWRMVFAYARRWQVEQAFRYNKSELAMESPRLWTWERRVRLLLIVTLVYAFLLSLLAPLLDWLRQWLLRHFCHRTGKRSQQTSAPLYRLRAALSHLWLAYPEQPPLQPQNSG